MNFPPFRIAGRAAAGLLAGALLGRLGFAAAPQAPVDLGLELVAIPSGTFVMGSPDSEPWRNSDPLTGEGPQTTVHLTKPFWLGKTEVTRGQYEAVMGNTEDPWSKKIAEALARDGADFLRYPAVNVTWDEANEFCRKLAARERSAGRLPPGSTYSLPTEAQWEYACRAGSTTCNYAGDTDDVLPEIAWYVKTTGPFNRGNMPRIQPVGKKKPNAWSLYDMLGNVREWVLDWIGPYPGGEVSDPRGPKEPVKGNLAFRVQRGGAWIDARSKLRCAARNWSDPAFGSHDGFKEGTVGFRVAVVAE